METVTIDVYKLINYPQVIAIQITTKLPIKWVYINYVIAYLLIDWFTAQYIFN
jgi:hypothetical protein